MKIFKTVQDWKNFKDSSSSSLGFVPTMGNLHTGHLSLIKRSQQENEQTAVSIFVNQTQFNQPEDYLKYPRTLEDDLALLQQSGIDYCFLPETAEMYADNYQFQIHETTHQQYLEGKHRPGHFTGVLTVVMKLLNIIGPNRAYFGEKDFEQLQYITHMTKAFFMNVEIIACPTLREPSGLALSSRNNRLSSAGKVKADTFASIFLNTSSVESTKKALIEAGIEIEYIEDQSQRRFAAVYIDGVRLIDNYAL